MEEKIKLKNIILLSIQGILIILYIFLFNILLEKPSKNPTISFQNTTNINFPENIKQAISEQLYNIVALNTKNETIIKNSGAKIQKDSLKENNSQNIQAGNFIINLENLNQSYRVYYEFDTNNKTTSGYPVTIECLDNSSCKSLFSSNSNYANLLYALPYHVTLNSDEYLNIEKDQYFSPKNKHITVTTNTCVDNKEKLNEINSVVNNWLNSNNLSVDQITTKTICDGNS